MFDAIALITIANNIDNIEDNQLWRFNEGELMNIINIHPALGKLILGFIALFEY